MLPRHNYLVTPVLVPLLALVVVSMHSPVCAFPLDADAAGCAGRMVRNSGRVLRAYGKATVKCVRDIGKQREIATDLGQCISADPSGTLAARLDAVDAGIDKGCGLPYAMDCREPCVFEDAGGPTTAIDGSAELKACLRCVNPAMSWSSAATVPALSGLHRAILDGVTLATTTSDRAAAKCQARLVKRYEKVFAGEVRALSGCARARFASVTLTGPPLECVSLAASYGKTVRALTRLARTVAACPEAAPLNAGDCAGIAGDPDLTACIEAVVQCRFCRWSSAVLGATYDCELFDDGSINDSCLQQLPVTTTTLAPPPTTTTTTTLAPPPTTTTTTTLAPPPTTTTTTTLAPPPTTTTTTTLAPPPPTTTTTTLAPPPTTTTTTLTPPLTTTTTTTLTPPPTTTTTTTGPVACGTFVAAWGSFGLSNGQFDRPRAVAVNSVGRVYVVDSHNNRVQYFDSTGGFIGRWGTLGQGASEFDRPRDLTIDTIDNVYVVDRSNNRVQKFMANGIFLTMWGTLGITNGEFNLPRGIVADATGNIFVADSGNHRIQKFDSNGTFMAAWGSFGTADGQFNLPRAMAVDAAGNLYVVDRDNNRIQKFASSGAFLGKWGSFGTGDGQFSRPSGVAVDAAGDVYVTDAQNHRIQKFTSSGTFLGKWGSFGVANGQLNSPHGIAVDGADIFVADMDNHRIQHFLCP